MDTISSGHERHLYVSWEDGCFRRVFRVEDNISFENGKAIFKLSNGVVMRIDTAQLVTIGISGNVDIDNDLSSENRKNNITPLFPKQ